MPSFFEEVSALGLGSRLKGVSDRLYEIADAVYRSRGSKFEARWFPVIRLLHDRGAMPVTQIAREVGLTHAAVSQLADRLVAEGWLATRVDPVDGRRRSLSLTPRTTDELRALAPLWRAIRETVIGRDGATELMAALDRFSTSLSASSPEEEILRRASRLEKTSVRIVPYAPALKPQFYRLNVEWLQKHFYLEEIDHRVLSDPEGEILASGGSLFFALLGDEAVGTCALKRESSGRYELTKMAVTETRRGLGIGRKLLEAAVAEFKRKRGRELFLESSSKLVTAIRLYETSGFVHAKRPALSHYQRADVYMVYAPAPAASRKSSKKRPARARA